ncbi:MAG: hypothetical protein EZS28_039427 [Streblomastix strix]|uniref:Uncharacterized protein n=1 Tax=Streblomastix strix TaxID=222440 RepID=A0A5J4U2Q1_9EUKA|nr:MAG: hypothetical protein EZS28_039427 [Streblomastix strix]
MSSLILFLTPPWSLLSRFTALASCQEKGLNQSRPQRIVGVESAFFTAWLELILEVNRRWTNLRPIPHLRSTYCLDYDGVDDEDEYQDEDDDIDVDNTSDIDIQIETINNNNNTTTTNNNKGIL